MSYYNCFDCKKISPLLGDMIDQCPLCHCFNGEYSSTSAGIGASESEVILEETESLIRQFRSVQLATLNAQGNPEASYAPYIRRSGCYYIFISGLASHTANILQHPALSLFFIQNEAEAKNVFSRQRLTLECVANVVSMESDQRNKILDAFSEVHGATVDLLRSLPDFQLFELTVKRGNYVKGFGQAFTMEGEGLKHVRKQQKEAPASNTNRLSANRVIS